MSTEQTGVLGTVEAMLPPHKGSLSIEHNEHTTNYQTVAEYLSDTQWAPSEDEWVTPTSKERAIATNSLWTMRVYPNTPVGFYRLAGATLEELLVAACASAPWGCDD